jgi:LysR family cys regulon transcriptional activator
MAGCRRDAAGGAARMNLHQFRFVQEAVRRNLNLTETAKALFTSQPGISKAILELEEELGVDIFARHGKRLRRVTEPGQQVLKSIEIIMREVANLKRIGEEFSKQDAGTLSIATTHTQARYFLPQPVAELRGASPRCRWCCTRACPSRWRACCWTTWPRSAWPPRRWPRTTS